MILSFETAVHLTTEVVTFTTAIMRYVIPVGIAHEFTTMFMGNL